LEELKRCEYLYAKTNDLLNGLDEYFDNYPLSVPIEKAFAKILRRINEK
jgi:hypothetical protein